MKRITVTGKNGQDFIFSNLIFNDDKELEFRHCSYKEFSGRKIVFNKDSKSLIVEDFENPIKLSVENNKYLLELEDMVSNQISSLYKNIVANKEELICFETGLKDFPYLITTPTLLESEIYSPKYVKALEYAFSDAVLKANNVGVYPGFKGYEDMQSKLGQTVVNMGLKPNYQYGNDKVIKTTLKELLGGVKYEN